MPFFAYPSSFNRIQWFYLTHIDMYEHRVRTKIVMYVLGVKKKKKKKIDNHTPLILKYIGFSFNKLTFIYLILFLSKTNTWVKT